MTRILIGLSLAILVAAFQLSLSGPISAFSDTGSDTTNTWKCVKTDWCTTPIPDIQNWECAEGLLSGCSEGTTSQGCKTCRAGISPVGN